MPPLSCRFAAGQLGHEGTFYQQVRLPAGQAAGDEHPVTATLLDGKAVAAAIQNEISVHLVEFI